MLNPHPDLTSSVIRGLGWLYLILFFANMAWTVRSYRVDGHFDRLFGISHLPKACIWAMYSALLLLVASAHLVFNSDPSTFLLRMPDALKGPLDAVVANPVSFFALSILLFVIVAVLTFIQWQMRRKLVFYEN